MRQKNFVIVLLLMVAMPSLADDRAVVFEETFSEGFGDFTVENEDVPESVPQTWFYENTGNVRVNAKSDYSGQSHLVSPVIDLTSCHDAVMSFDWAKVGGNSNIISIYIKDEDGDWHEIMYTGYTEATDNVFYASKKFFLNRYNGHKIRIRFSTWLASSTSISNKIKNFKIEAFDGPKTDQPIKVDCIKDFLALPESTFAEIKLTDAVVTWMNSDMFFIKDSSAGLCVAWDGRHYGVRGTYPWAVHTGTISGVRSSQFCLNEMSDPYMETAITSDEEAMMSGDPLYPPVSIKPDQLEDYDCDNVTCVIQDPDLIYFYNEKDFSEPSYTKTYSGVVYILNGVACLTPDKKRRIMVQESNYLDGAVSEDYKYNYNGISEWNSIYLFRPFHKGYWHTAAFPFDIDKNLKENNYSLRNATIAVLSNADNGVFNFKTVSSFDSYTIEAGTPMLIKIKNNDLRFLWASSSCFKDVGGQIKISCGDYNFVGTLAPVQPADGSYYLSANNTIRPLAPGGTIKGFRAYFEPNTPNAAQARAISIDGVVTAIEDFPLADDLFAPTGKVYTVSGQYVGDDLEVQPKGMYIVNGKKVIK